MLLFQKKIGLKMQNAKCKIRGGGGEGGERQALEEGQLEFFLQKILKKYNLL